MIALRSLVPIAGASLASAEYGTAMAAIILQMPDNSVPIFQK